MKIFIGGDHRGFELKADIMVLLKKLGHTVVDMGSYEPGVMCDYPPISYAVASKVAKTKGSRGILACMTGIGHSIAANKIVGAYAALCYSKEAAILSRQHNNANILVLGAKFVKPEEITKIVKVWLVTEFEGGRHLRRLKQIKAIEKTSLFHKKK
ncbi:MAG: ribose 5-phosphate isomerase B [Candidatus Omnitrophica bacterium]|nr:ribose 5-phosphate isomerase B [Candidatus Omnitrophota bacterium]